MPSGFNPYAPALRSDVSHGPGLALRVRVWLHKSELDSALADGADPTDNEELALRAEQLADQHARHRLAATIDAVLDLADQDATPKLPLSRVPFRREYIQANRTLLIELAERLRGQGPHALQGVAMASVLVEDGRGPLFHDNHPGSLERTLRATLSALDSYEDSRVRLAA